MNCSFLIVGRPNKPTMFQLTHLVQHSPNPNGYFVIGRKNPVKQSCEFGWKGIQSTSFVYWLFVAEEGVLSNLFRCNVIHLFRQSQSKIYSFNIMCNVSQSIRVVEAIGQRFRNLSPGSRAHTLYILSYSFSVSETCLPIA